MPMTMTGGGAALGPRVRIGTGSVHGVGSCILPPPLTQRVHIGTAFFCDSRSHWTCVRALAPEGGLGRIGPGPSYLSRTLEALGQRSQGPHWAAMCALARLFF